MLALGPFEPVLTGSSAVSVTLRATVRSRQGPTLPQVQVLRLFDLQIIGDLLNAFYLRSQLLGPDALGWSLDNAR